MAKRINFAALPHIEYEPREGVIFGLALPLQLAPTLNEYASLCQQRPRKWKLAAIHRELAKRIGIARLICRAHARVAKHRRKVVVTRHSSVRPDDISVDVVGGKLPVDHLHKADIIVQDTDQWLEREAHWVKAPPRKGKLVIEVFECEEPPR